MYYARIKSEVVVSICFFSDTSLIPAFTEGYDALVPLGSNPENVQCGDLYDADTNSFISAG